MQKHISLMIKIVPVVILAALFVLSLTVPPSLLAKGPPEGKGPDGGGHETGAGNNLSFPVIWSEGETKTLPGTPGMIPLLGGEWWYWWGMEGTDPNIVPLSCPPDPDGDLYCDDETPNQVTFDNYVGNEADLVKAYLQKKEGNVWQAGSADWSSDAVEVHWIDWGDNLESVDWYTRSQVRTEVVLFQDLGTSMLEYEMRHTSGWGIDEVHGLACSLADEPQYGDGMRATVYSHCARLTIQKLLVDRDDVRLSDLVWVPGEGWTEPEGYPDDLINPPIFNKPVYEGGDGPGYYSAEINVKGRIIYGYTWNVRDMHDITGGTAAGDYRITFSFDTQCGDEVTLNTFFIEGVTQIIVPTEEALIAAAASEDESESEPGGGGEATLVPAEFDGEENLTGGNLTYIDIRILERSGGGGGGHGGSGGGSGGGGGHRR